MPLFSLSHWRPPLLRYRIYPRSIGLGDSSTALWITFICMCLALSDPLVNLMHISQIEYDGDVYGYCLSYLCGLREYVHPSPSIQDVSNFVSPCCHLQFSSRSVSYEPGVPSRITKPRVPDVVSTNTWSFDCSSSKDTYSSRLRKAEDTSLVNGYLMRVVTASASRLSPVWKVSLPICLQLLVSVLSLFPQLSLI